MPATTAAAACWASAWSRSPDRGRDQHLLGVRVVEAGRRRPSRRRGRSHRAGRRRRWSPGSGSSWPGRPRRPRTRPSRGSRAMGGGRTSERCGGRGRRAGSSWLQPSPPGARGQGCQDPSRGGASTTVRTGRLGEDGAHDRLPQRPSSSEPAQPGPAAAHGVRRRAGALARAAAPRPGAVRGRRGAGASSGSASLLVVAAMPLIRLVAEPAAHDRRPGARRSSCRRRTGPIAAGRSAGPAAHAWSPTR